MAAWGGSIDAGAWDLVHAAPPSCVYGRRSGRSSYGLPGGCGSAVPADARGTMDRRRRCWHPAGTDRAKSAPSEAIKTIGRNFLNVGASTQPTFPMTLP